VKIRKLLPWVAVVGFCLAPAAMAQTGSTPAPSNASQPNKIAVLDIQGVIVGTAEGKQAAAELQSQFAPQQANMEKVQKQIEDIGKKLQTGGNTLSDEEKARLQRNGELLQKNLQRMQDELTDEANSARGEVLDRIGRKVVELVDRYARENGIGVVIDSSGQASPVLYRAAALDISGEIVKLYDQQYPVKAAASAPATKPSNPPPATQTPAKKPGGGPGGQQ
jgi:outer membrane protein